MSDLKESKSASNSNKKPPARRFSFAAVALGARTLQLGIGSNSYKQYS
jgi:hypothetical protein